MASIISIGISFLIFFIVLGFMWLIGIHLLAMIFDSIDEQMAGRDADDSWLATKESIKSNVQIIMLWALPVLMLFASIRMLANAGGQGQN